MKRKAKHRFLYIEWDDHSSGGSTWNTADEHAKYNRAYRCASAGWVVAENREAITLCGTRGPRDQERRRFSSDITILKRCIRKKRRLRE